MRDVDGRVQPGWHLTVEQRQQQRTNVSTVDVRIGHDNDATVVAQFVDIEFIRADAGAGRGDQRGDLFGRQHFSKRALFDVQNFTAQRENRLEFTIATLFR